MKESLKEINYREGVLKFNIPAIWEEVYEEDGGGLFYEDTPDAGTLHLNIITLQTPPDLTENLAVEALSSVTDVGINDIEMLSNGNALARSIQRTQEQGIDITSHWWYIVNQIPPNYMRMANFSYTIVSAQENTDSFNNELNLLDGLIKNAVFHPDLAE